jgi:hypothetical protein
MDRGDPRAGVDTRSRSTGSPMRGRWRCQHARNHASTRGASGRTRSLSPLPWGTRPRSRGASMVETRRGVPSVRRSPQAEIGCRHLWAVGGSTQARRCRTACGLSTTGRFWRCRGRTCVRTGHGRWSVISERYVIPSRWIRKVRSAPFCSFRRPQQSWRSSVGRERVGRVALAGGQLGHRTVASWGRALGTVSEEEEDGTAVKPIRKLPRRGFVQSG